MSRKSLAQHIAEKHGRVGFAYYIKELVYGGTDGIITTFAVVAGFAGANTQNTVIPVLTVLLFGFANLMADAVSMALGDFLSSKSEIDVYKKELAQEKNEIETNPEEEKAESIQILIDKGFTKEQAEQLTAIYMTNPSYWLQFMMHDELELADPDEHTVLARSLVTFFAFIGFGMIPLLPYIINSKNAGVFTISIISTFFALAILGIVRFVITRHSIVRSILESVFLGGAAASVAYIVGTLFRI